MAVARGLGSEGWSWVVAADMAARGALDGMLLEFDGEVRGAEEGGNGLERGLLWYGIG